MTRLQILDFLFEHRRTEICLGSIFIRFTSIQYAFHEIKRSLRITWNTCKEKQKEKLTFRSLSLKILVFIIIEFQSSFFVSCQIGLRFELLDLQYAAQLGRLLLMIFPIVCAKNETPIVYSGQSLVQYPQKPNAAPHSLTYVLSYELGLFSHYQILETTSYDLTVSEFQALILQNKYILIWQKLETYPRLMN